MFGRIRLFCCCHPPDSEEPYWLHRTSRVHRLRPMVVIHWLYECPCERAISTNANTTAQRSVVFGKKNMKYTKKKTQTTFVPAKSRARAVTSTHHTLNKSNHKKMSQDTKKKKNVRTEFKQKE